MAASQATIKTKRAALANALALEAQALAQHGVFDDLRVHVRLLA